ncbi:MAG: hypothetical protein A2268_09965 [Candidatus Raymondbacteria bacterium RifOxyA12_full_50_37]|uniref:DNA-directed DNA polymerase n=1 Tax=Candidatus Raymondbacteria bacterium RIFOXYD12_FULL_49_13 TaxID=1817890 RepID=A0A1F7F4B1_UNCRA|nr:MAG: hypothetical protein A2350_16245 [Candidatus Raymondbacteria bacterium RifOxyB12_full_50_8]OGJ90957.1 MAG: hypothetical protein A2268_09965 [Candidatus Raymondbacteria bacterium RifOxyA12_full_50_37]OGJ93837.1 MAG: hypothetical protein A2248_06335 [Candidatus Raymondbacteria bacterium RIFOXYA2_FULL_49_16]OGJ97327.1 MAG: hypothetical protein A2487_16495 [Candidatus Raymondbacteria bacterium RifOxyC12_full_50_8]OGJ98296.1 MAG: hypothetical protein A2453_00840 [Candidatus Raymondbacteria b
MARAASPKGGPEPEIIRYRAGDSAIETVISDASTPNLFGTTSFIIITECQNLRSEALEALAVYFKAPSPTTILICEGASIGKKLGKDHPFTRALKESKKFITLVECPSPPDYKMHEWASETSRSRYKRSLNEDAARLLIECTGTNQSRITSELEKLDIVLNPGMEIGEKEIREYTGGAGEKQPWDLAPAVARKEIDSALGILANLFEFNTPALQMLYALNTHFAGLLRLKIYFSNQRELLAQTKKLARMGFRGKDEFNRLMAEAIKESRFSERPLPPNMIYARIVLPRLLDQLDNYSLDQLTYILRYLATIDVNLKTGLFKGGLIDMERVILSIMYSDKHRMETIL